MLKQTITYTDYNGVERTEDFYFNLTKSEIIKLELGTEGRLTESLKSILNKMDIPKMIKLLEEIVLKSYGEKSLDGKRFIKSEEMSTAFSQSAAYDELFTSFSQDPNNAAKFLRGVIPETISNELSDDAVKEQLKEIGISEQVIQAAQGGNAWEHRQIILNL